MAKQAKRKRAKPEQGEKRPPIKATGLTPVAGEQAAFERMYVHGYSRDAQKRGLARPANQTCAHCGKKLLVLNAHAGILIVDSTTPDPAIGNRYLVRADEDGNFTCPCGHRGKH